MGTPQELRPIAELVLAWVAHARRGPRPDGLVAATDDELRRAELCALAVQEVCMLYELYGPVDSDT